MRAHQRIRRLRGGQVKRRILTRLADHVSLPFALAIWTYLDGV